MTMPRGRATTSAELEAIFQSPFFATLRRAHAFVARPSDVLVVGLPKCGITLVRQIAHGLRTAGAMDFEDISLVVPWIEAAPSLGLDIERMEQPEPRVFRCQLPWESAPKGARYIHIMRDPADIIVSHYHFFNGVMFERDAIDVNTFATEFWLSGGTVGGDYFKHLSSWWGQHGRNDVLLLSYAGMRRDLVGGVRRIAAFMGIDADDELVTLLTRQSTMEFMRAHESQFGDWPIIRAMCLAAGLPTDVRARKVRQGRVGESREVLSAEVLEIIAARWRDVPFSFSDDGASVELHLEPRAAAP